MRLSRLASDDPNMGVFHNLEFIHRSTGSAAFARYKRLHHVNEPLGGASRVEVRVEEQFRESSVRIRRMSSRISSSVPKRGRRSEPCGLLYQVAHTYGCSTFPRAAPAAAKTAGVNSATRPADDSDDLAYPVGSNGWRLRSARSAMVLRRSAPRPSCVRRRDSDHS